jgi:hypothetical protein
MPPTEADLLAGDILHLDEVGDMAEFTARLVRRPAGIGREQV